MHALLVVATLLAVAVALPVGPAAKHQVKKAANPAMMVRALLNQPARTRYAPTRSAHALDAPSLLKRYIGVVLGGYGGGGGSSSSSSSSYGSKGWSSSSYDDDDDDYYDDDYYGDEYDNEYDDDSDEYDDDDDDYRTVQIKRSSKDNEKVVAARHLSMLAKGGKKAVRGIDVTRGLKQVLDTKAIHSPKYTRGVKAVQSPKFIRGVQAIRRSKSVRGVQAIASPKKIRGAQAVHGPKATRDVVHDPKATRDAAHQKRFRQSQWTWMDDKKIRRDNSQADKRAPMSFLFP